MSAAVAAAAAAAAMNQHHHNSARSQRSSKTPAQYYDYNAFGNNNNKPLHDPPDLSRYESQKRRDWVAFGQYLRNHRPPLALYRCSGGHVLEFLKYLDQFGETKVHSEGCPFFGQPNTPAACPCPLRQAWRSLDALVGRLRAAFEENGGCPETNPFGGRAVSLYLREVRDAQAKARGIEKNKRRKPLPTSSHGSHQSTGTADPSSYQDLSPVLSYASSFTK